MMLAVKFFNKCYGSTDMHLHLTKYFKVQGISVSGRDFKMLDLTEDIKEEDIEKTLRKVIPGGPFYLKPRITDHNDQQKLYFTIANEREQNILKDTWSIIIKGQAYRIAPAEM